MSEDKQIDETTVDGDLVVEGDIQSEEGEIDGAQDSATKDLADQVEAEGLYDSGYTGEAGEELSEFEQMVEDARDEIIEAYGEKSVTSFLIDVSLDPGIGKLILDATEKGRFEEAAELMGGKPTFFLHTEPNGERYLMMSPHPRDFKEQWTMLLAPAEQYGIGQERLEEYRAQLFETVMVYPRYDEVDWEYEGDKMYRPRGLTKNRLEQCFWRNELPDPGPPAEVAFDAGEELDRGLEIARKKKEAQDAVDMVNL